MRLKLVLIALAAGMLAGAANSKAQDGEHGIDHEAAQGACDPMYGGGFHGRFVKRMFRKLDLAPEQQAVIEGIIDTTRPQLETLRNDLHTQRVRLRNLSPDDPDYSAIVAEISQTSGALLTQLIEVKGQIKAEVHAVLTPDQRAEAAAHRDAMHERIRKRFEDRRP